MRDLVAEMAEQRAVGLAHLVPAPLALGVVGLGEVDGDEPVVVAGQHRRGAVGEKIEGEAVPGPRAASPAAGRSLRSV